MSSRVGRCRDKLGKECREIWALQACDARLRVEQKKFNVVMCSNADGREAQELRMKAMELSESAHTKGLSSSGPELNE